MPPPSTLAELPLGATAVLRDLDLAPTHARYLMELGFLPGARILAVATAPGGDPRVYRVDGADLALRGETARHLVLDTTP